MASSLVGPRGAASVGDLGIQAGVGEGSPTSERGCRVQGCRGRTQRSAQHSARCASTIVQPKASEVRGRELLPDS
jgi:hypothetical protein